MAKKYKTKFLGLPTDTKIEVIKFRGDKIYKKIMTHGEALNLPTQKGSSYVFYQIGFSQYKNVIEL